jgi:cell division septum initiation protein DivIVA
MELEEAEALRARVEELERELAERTAEAEAAVAAAQERSYWVDRLPFDLNAVMSSGPGRALYAIVVAVARAVRALGRRLR